MKRTSILAVVLSMSLMPLGGCGWLDAPPNEFQSGVDAGQSAVDAAEAEIARLQREVDRLEGQPWTPENAEMLARMEEALEKATDIRDDAQGLLDDWQARLDAAPTNGDLLAAAASEYAGYLFPGAGVIVALAGGWLREWGKKKEAKAETATVVKNIDLAKVPASAARGADRKVQTVSVDVTKLAALNTASGVEETVEAARKAA